MAQYKRKDDGIEAVKWDGKKSTFDDVIALLAKSDVSPEILISYTATGYGYMRISTRSEYIKQGDYIVFENGVVYILDGVNFENKYEVKV